MLKFTSVNSSGIVECFYLKHQGFVDRFPSPSGFVHSGKLQFASTVFLPLCVASVIHHIHLWPRISQVFQGILFDLANSWQYLRKHPPALYALFFVIGSYFSPFLSVTDDCMSKFLAFSVCRERSVVGSKTRLPRRASPAPPSGRAVTAVCTVPSVSLSRGEVWRHTCVRPPVWRHGCVSPGVWRHTCLSAYHFYPSWSLTLPRGGKS